MRTIRFGTAVLSVGLALTVLGAAGSSPVGATSPGDPQTYSGNVTTCAAAGLAGTQYDGSLSGSDDMGLFTATVVDGQYVTLSDVSDGVVFTGVVLKGGDNYNVYSAPVASMQAPLNNGSNVPTLSHWFVCYTYTVPTTTEMDTEVTLQEITETTEVASEGPTTTTQVASEGPTSTLVGSAGADFDELPTTGRSSNELVAFGSFLVLLGGAIMWLTRRPLSI